MALDLNDKTSNGNTLTNIGAADDTVDSPFAASTHVADLEASESDYLYAADSASLSFTQSFTLEGWFKFESLPSSNDMFLISKSNDDAVEQRSYSLILTDSAGSKTLRAIISSDGTYDSGNDKSVSWSPSTATWYHIALVYDHTAPSLKFYVDGAQQGATQTPSATSIHNGTARLGLGAYRATTTPSLFFDGKMDEIRVWNVARSGAQINDNKAIELTGSESGLVAYYPFEALDVAGGINSQKTLLGVGL